MEKNSRDRMKWTQIILIFAFMLFIPALIALSIVSFLQTESAFQIMNDSTLSFLGMSIGSYISYFMAIIFQYGQNVALFIRKHFLTDDIVLDNMFFQISEKDLAMGAFIICAVIDAGTNVIWFATNVDAHTDPILNMVIKVVGYSSMIVIIFVEETLGWAIDGFSKAMNQLKSITQYDKKKTSFEKNTNNNQPSANTNHTPNRNPNQSGFNHQNRSVNTSTNNPLLSNIPRVGNIDEKQMGYNTDKIFEDKGLEEDIERMRRLRENRV